MFSAPDLETRIEQELSYFDSDEQRRAFQAFRISPRDCTESWQYGPESHICTIIATDGKTQIVFCPTGFGPSFPWGVQRVAEDDLGPDSAWNAYLYEAFINSSMWQGARPENFMHMAPGERGA